MKRVFFLIFFACVTMLITPLCVNAGTFLGTFCFEAPSLGNVFVMNVETTVGAGDFTTLTVTGMNTLQKTGFSGGGVLIGNVAKIFLGETAFSSPTILGQLHSIVIDLTTMSGTDDIVMHTGIGTISLIPDVHINAVACP